VSEPIDPSEQHGEHGEWDALAVGWALSALDPEDEECFADHLPGCDRCTATVRESLYTVADLAYALPDEAPPPSLRSRLMAAVASEPRTPALAQEADLPGEPDLEEEWPLGEPHPGSPGYGIDWFAKAPRSADGPADDVIHQPPVADRRAGPAPVAGVDEPTAESHRPDLAGAIEDRPSDGDLRSEPDHVEDPPAGRRELGSDLDEVEDRAARPDRAPSGYRGGDLADAGVSDRGEEAAVIPLASRRRTVRRVSVGVAAAAVLALIAGLLAWNVNLRNEQDDLRQVVAEREAAIQQLTANGPARVAALTADGQPSPERRATLVVRGDQIEIIIETLGATTGNETYWLWTLRCDTPQPTDLKPIRGFTVTQSEFSVRDIGSDPGVASAPCFAISSELGAATPKAPRQVVAVGQPE
jgi:hypothetical protein